MTTTVRPGTAEDARAIADVRIVSWRMTYGEYLPEHVWDELDPAATAMRFAQRLAAGSLGAVVAEVDATVCGYALYSACRDDDLPGAGEVQAIYVHPDHLSTGLGRDLLAAALEALGVRPVTLWVLEENTRARRFYEIAGFRTDGARKQADLLGGVTMPEIRYRLD